MKKPENTRRKEDGRFQAGFSGNPAGRPKGTRNTTTLAAQQLLSGEAETLTRKAIELALAGNLAALRLCLDRLLPIRRGAPIQIDLGPLKNPAQMQGAFDRITQSLAMGQISPAELASVIALLSEFMKFFELIAFEERLKALEDAIANANQEV